MENVTPDRELDTRGLNCPMPLVKARQAVAQLGIGQVLKVIATDRGSLKDFQGWANIAKNIELVRQETSERPAGNEYLHYIRRTA
jgi:Predicted redox protein, regulator of disulfide bond formation